MLKFWANYSLISFELKRALRRPFCCLLFSRCYIYSPFLTLPPGRKSLCAIVIITILIYTLCGN
ncbi:elongation factor Tu [Salmonella enterica subsp. enterica serovar Offa]|uniref:Elongation factor Tu n=3 Tax=Salmonella enterica I TaxID=59201 RepID=A0A5U6I6Z5_SALET|nr:elongation factor Tu [Salmonella enterica subsp. enterica serovar Kedougou]EAU2365221.1 elongation factor Tu [Salmonella enterica]EBU8756689.1 elongation factor Tu [Salmonella enterica subsp. enterica serovar Offa]EBV2360667.1 elongation factor Tu [Salmonella enterica subsp. enterica serovar Ago]ECE1001651.1 elongation factor Tu [Salmonella enterica subsp. enterica serovar Bere]ECG1298278.1 elongation factor Tu [Salmonella enterica subsp. enterica]